MLYMTRMEYTTPEMDVIDFGNEDLVCTVSGVDYGNGTQSGIVEEDKDHPYTDGDF